MKSTDVIRDRDLHEEVRQQMREAQDLLGRLIPGLLDECRRLRADAEAAQAEATQLQAHAEPLRTENEQLRMQVCTSEQECEKLRQELGALRIEFETFRKEVGEIVSRFVNEADRLADEVIPRLDAKRRPPQ